MRNLARERGDSPQQPAPAPAPERTRTPQPPAAQAVPKEEEAPAGEQPPEAEPLPEGEATPTGEADQVAATDEGELDFDSLPKSVQDLIERTREREQAAQTDYTRKTQKIAETARQLEQDSEVIRRTAQFVAGVIDAPVRQMERADWATLQTQDPAEYQRRRAQYEQTVNARNHIMQQLAGMEQEHEKALERHKKEIAAVSREILKTKIDGWSNERYVSLRDFAVKEYGFTREEVDRNVDHKLIELLNDVHVARQAKDKLKAVRRDPQQQKPQGANRPAVRNEAGQFQSARQNFQSRPGDRNAAREFFKAKLAAERKRNG
jgi:hypothetical protein